CVLTVTTVLSSLYKIRMKTLSTRLDCYHGNDDYPYMLWAVELIGYHYYENANIEKNFEARFTTTGQSKGRAWLVISNITSTDSAEYFCAASQHSA
uniref:Ig-like domain-containing protein n=1 Tax=Mola mola TaxID=94237 RepID=A0A3Q3WTT9_MOLML